MTTPTTDPVQQAADVITRAGEAHQAAITAWSHDADPATARTPPADLTSLDLAEALADAGLIATETEWGVAFPCRPGCPAGDEHISSEDFGAGEEMARALIADDSDRLTLKIRHVTPWKDADA